RPALARAAGRRERVEGQVRDLDASSRQPACLPPQSGRTGPVRIPGGAAATHAERLPTLQRPGTVTFAIEWVTDEAGVAGLSHEWDALLPPDSRPFDLHCWHLAWWEAFGHGHKLAICTVRDGDALAGVFPLLRRRGELEALANVHSNAFRPLASGPEAMDELIAAALKGAAGLTLTELWEGDAFIESLLARPRNARVGALFQGGNR